MKPAQGKRPDQLNYSLLVVLWCAVLAMLGLVTGAAVALWQAILTH